MEADALDRLVLEAVLLGEEELSSPVKKFLIAFAVLIGCMMIDTADFAPFDNLSPADSLVCLVNFKAPDLMLEAAMVAICGAIGLKAAPANLPASSEVVFINIKPK